MRVWVLGEGPHRMALGKPSIPSRAAMGIRSRPSGGWSRNGIPAPGPSPVRCRVFGGRIAVLDLDRGGFHRHGAHGPFKLA